MTQVNPMKIIKSTILPTNILSFLLFLTIFTLFLLCSPIETEAENSVNLTATVVAKKPTDTINDFDFIDFNLDNYQKTVSSQNSQEGIVKGASTESESFWTYCYKIFAQITSNKFFKI